MGIVLGSRSEDGEIRNSRGIKYLLSSQLLSFISGRARIKFPLTFVKHFIPKFKRSKDLTEQGLSEELSSSRIVF